MNHRMLVFRLTENEHALIILTLFILDANIIILKLTEI